MTKNLVFFQTKNCECKINFSVRWYGKNHVQEQCNAKDLIMEKAWVWKYKKVFKRPKLVRYYSLNYHPVGLQMIFNISIHQNIKNVGHTITVVS